MALLTWECELARQVSGEAALVPPRMVMALLIFLFFFVRGRWIDFTV